MMNQQPIGRRNRRGVEAIEFAMILPIFIVIIFAVFEFSWYMFQRGSVVDAARRGCRVAAQLDPSIDAFQAEVEAQVNEVLENSNLHCGATGVTCGVVVAVDVDASPPRVQCVVTATYRPLTGLFGQTGSGGSLSGMEVGRGTWGGIGVLPDNLRGRASAVLEGVEDI